MLSVFTDWWTNLQTPYQQAVITLLTVAATFLAAHLVKFIWNNVLRPIARRTPTKADLMLVEDTALPVYIVVLTSGLYLSFLRLIGNVKLRMSAEEFADLKGSLGYKIADGVLYSLTVFAVAYIVYAAVRAVLEWYMKQVAVRTRTRLDDEMIPLIRRIAKIVIFFVALTYIMQHYDKPIMSLLGAAGIASIAVAFAAQETLSNIIAGIALMFDRPFRMGDRIELPSGQIGDVHEIGMRSTKILSFDNNLIVVPNSEMAKSMVVNYAYPDLKYKIRQVIGVAYGSDIAKVKSILLDIANTHPEVLDDPAPVANFYTFAESSLDIYFIVWVKDYKEHFRIRDEINCEINRRFEAEGVTIPFPQRTVHLRQE